MRLADFIEANIEPILAEWETFARSLLPGKGMTVFELRDDAEAMLLASARDMKIRQSLQQQESKAKGHGGARGLASASLDDASAAHGAQRMGSGFHITEVVAEYRAVRASVLRLWRESLPTPDLNDIDDLTRFDELLDQSLASSVASYAGRIDESRQMFLAILSHDLRNPLNTIHTAAHIVSLKNSDGATADAVSMINRSTDAMARLISDLIDFSSSGLGRAMPLHREPVDLESLCIEVIDSFRTTHPGRELRFHSVGDVNGFWDPARVRQVVSNLIGNALQHGSPEGPIDVSVSSRNTAAGLAGRRGLEGSVAELNVHNEGAPIPPTVLPTIFEPLKRYATRESASHRAPGSIGLGLYIVREIVVAKAGTVSVTSSAEEGTTFTVCLPRVIDARRGNRQQAEPSR